VVEAVAKALVAPAVVLGMAMPVAAVEAEVATTVTAAAAPAAEL